jgi:8-oxo-dGTP pyrophosphatase MutT (NUDIX family)
LSKKITTWEIIESKLVADCRVFKVREDFCESSENGTKASFFVIENPDWVNIIALTKNKKVILIEQFRQGTNEVTLEIPGGMVDEDEEPVKCAERELLEETGFVAKEMIFLGKSHPNPALQENVMFHFLALDCEKIGETKFDEHESIETKLFPISDIPKLIADEEITHSLVLAAFYRLDNYKKGHNL